MTVEESIINCLKESLKPLMNGILEAKSDKDIIYEKLDNIYYPVSMVSELIGKSKATIYNMIDRGKLKARINEKKAVKVLFKDFKHLIK